MKKKRMVVFISLFFLVMSAPESISATEAGQVLTVKKKVYRIRKEQRINAKPQMPLLLNDAVETDRGSRTKLFFKDDSILNMGELSRVVVEEYLYSPEKQRSRSIYRLIDGSLKVVVGRSDLEIHTPTAVAAARGTKFIIWAESRKSCAMVSEGEVVMRSNKEHIEETVTIGAGNMSCVPKFNPPDPVARIAPKDLKRFSEQTVVTGNTVFDKTKMPPRIPVKGPSPRTAAGQAVESVKRSAVIEQPPVVQEPVHALTPVTINVVFP
jgi:hypothetical protein